MKKKIWLPLLVVMIMMCSFMFDKEVLAASVSGTYGDLTWTYTYTDNVLPEPVGGGSVYYDGTLEISGNGGITSTSQSSYPWYQYRDSTTVLIIGEGITSIGRNAFRDFVNLKEIHYDAISAEVDTHRNAGHLLNAGAATTNTGIDVYIGPNVTKIPSYMFDTRTVGDSSPNLKSVTFEGDGYVEEIGQSAFGGCTNLSEVRISNLDNWAKICFSGIESNPLYYAQNLMLNGQLVQHATINAETVGNGAFERYGKLQSVVFGDNVKVIRSNAFNYSGLQTVTLGKNIQDLGMQAFSNCPGLSEIEFPSTLTELGAISFMNCSGLHTVTFTGDAPEYGALPLAGVTATIYYPGAKEGWTEELKADMGLREGSTWIAYCEPGQHTFTNYVYNNDASCTQDGTETAPCASCGLESHTRTAVGTALGHSFVDGLCTRCGAEGEVASGAWGTTITWSLNRQGVLTISGTGVIPEVMEENGIGDVSWWNYRERVTSVVVNEGITGLGISAFYGMNNLAEVTLPNTLMSIAAHPFMGSKIQTLTLPANVETLATYAFYGMTELEKINVVSGNTSFSSDSQGALYNKDKTKLVYVPTNVSKDFIMATSVTEVGESAFAGTVNVTKVDLHEGVRTVGYYAFTESCVNEIVIPASLKSIHEDTIVVSGITAVTVHKDNTVFSSVGDNQLFNKNKTRLIWTDGITGSYVVPDTVEEIAMNAFWLNDDLEKVTIPAGIKKIEYGAFDSCSNLKTVVFKGNAPAFGYDPFSLVTATVFYPEDNKTWTSGVKKNYGGTLTWSGYTGDVIDLGLCGANATWTLTSDGILTISGSGAMTNYEFGISKAAPWKYAADKITSIVVKSGITRVGDYAFNGLEKVKTVTLPSSLTAIGESAFESCTSLKAISIPNSVSSIGEAAFGWCSSLETFNIPSSLKTIARWTFSGTAIKTLKIPATITDLADSAFSVCMNLKKIYFLGNAPTAGADVFEAVKAAAYYRSGNYTWTSSKQVLLGTNATLTWGSGSYLSGSCGTYTTYELLMDGSLYISGNGSMTDYTYNYGAPWKGYNVREVYLEEGVLTVGDYAFYNCTGIQNISLPESVYYIGQNAFFQCYGIKELVIPDAVYMIGSKAFYRCEGLEKIKLPKSLGAIYESTFLECGELKEIVIPENVKYVLDYAFNRCYKLEKITFEGNVPEIYDYAFYSLEAKVYYPAKDSTWTSSVRKDYGGNMTWRCVVPTTPGSVKATNTASTGKIKLIWKTSPEATKYRIYRATSKTGTYKLIKTLSKSYLSYTDSDAKIGTTYYYKITAVDENGKASSYSSVVSQTPDLKRPTIKVTNVASTGKLKVTWSKITGAKQYKIYRATSKSGTYKLLKTQTGVTYTDTSASAGKTYYYKVVAVHSNTKANSAYSEIVSGVCDLKQPTIKVSVVTSSGKLKVTWSKITGAKQYKIYRATSKTGTYKLVKTQTGTSYTDTSAAVGKTYYYKVVAVHSTSKANSAYSEVKSGLCTLKQPNVTVKLSSKKPVLTWSKITGAKQYKIYRATSENGKYTLLKTQTAVKYTDTKAVKGKAYYYKVVAVHSNTKANSAYSAVDKIKVK